jgi:dienelactone hydrolase
MRIRNIVLLFNVIALLMGGTMLGQDFTTRKVVYQIPAMEKVIIKQDIVYKTTDGKDLTFDLYYPFEFKGEMRLPVVIMDLGYADDVFKSPLKSWEVYKDWAKIFAASGMAAINYSTLQPATDIHDLIHHIRDNADDLSMDGDAIGIWSCSGNVINALTVLMDERKDYLKCAALYYGLMLTPDQKFHDTILKFSKMVNFSIEGIDKIKNFHKDLPLLIVRAGKDREDIIQTIDHYIAQAIANNVPLTLINYTDGRHAFDVLDDNAKSRDIIQQTLKFMKSHLFSKQ